MPVKGDQIYAINMTHIFSSVHGFPYTEHTEYGRIAPNITVHTAAAIHKLYEKFDSFRARLSIKG